MSRLAGTIAIQSKLQSTYRAIPGFLSTLAGSLLAAILLCAPATHAQVSASISGRVTDPTGAIVSAAAVVAKNVETGITRSTVTDDAGLYWVPSLTVGEYEVHVTKMGFQEQVRAGNPPGRRAGGHRGCGLEDWTGHRASQSERRRPGGQRDARRTFQALLANSK